jgi:RHS repeat-associated protein
MAGAGHVPGIAQGSGVDYRGATQGSDVAFAAGTGMITEQIVLHSPHAPASWLFPLNLTGLTARMGPGGIVEFTDPAGTVRAYVPQGFMTDSNINPHSGDGALSSGVSYVLTTVNGRPAIRMTLDTSWLDSKDRVYPVTVDPSVNAVNSNGTTYVQSGENADFSGATEIHMGTWDGGADTARSFLKFDNVSTALKNDTVLGVRLGVFNTWSYSCSPRSVNVYPVTAPWPLTGNKSWPGPAIDSTPVGRATFATGWVPLGSTVSPCPASWEGIDLDQAGTNLVNGWTHGTVANNGLALGASNSDSYAWKKFASDSTGTGDPFLSVTYTTDGATYALASSRPVKQVLPGQNGQFAVKVTNTGSSTWSPSNGYELSYRAYNAQGKLIADHPVFTPMPSTVAPGGTVTVNATVNALSAGSYAIDFDMYSGATGSSPVSFSSQGIPPFAMGLYVPQPPPVVSNVYPPTGYISPTLTPQLSTVASTQSGTITYSFSITCAPLPGQTCPASVINSGTLSVPYWTVPAAEMQWNTPYQWTVRATVNGASTTVGPVTLTPEVPQPAITSSLGAASGQAFDPQSGDYTTSAADAAVASAGPPLRIDRAYNSLDPRTSGAFGVGWSTVLDTVLRPDSDGSGNVVVTMPDGQQTRFGQNGNGTYAPPFGSPDVLVKNSGGTWTLRDSSSNEYDFTSAGQLSQIIDQNGVAQVYTDNSSGQVATVTNTASGRSLQLTWSTPAGAAYAHVASVSTSAPASGQSGFAWSYTYTGDDLTQVCAPSSGCTAYTYTTGSHYRAAVLDSGPRSYWQLGDPSGATAAADEVDANLGTTDGTYHNVTLGAAGPLAGSTESAASFNGTSSSVSLPAGLITDGTDVSVGLWFKAASSTASGVLFSYQADALTSSTGNTDHHDPALYVGGNGELYGEFWNGSVDPIHTTTTVDDGNWHYAVLTGQATSQSLYLDGILVGTLSGQINQQNMSVDTIGAGFWQGGWPNAYVTVGPTLTNPPIGYFNGSIAQAAVYPDGLGQPAASSQHALAATASPELTKVTLPSGNIHEQASYDPATGRLASYTDPDGGQWAISGPVTSGYKATSDSLGVVLRHVTVTDPAGREERYGYDALDGGRLVSYSNGPDPARTFGYDAAGYLASVTDEDGNLACFTNDIHGNALTRTWYPVEPASLPGGGTGSVTGCGGSTSSSPSCATSGAPCTTFYSYSYNASNPLDPRNDKLTAIRDGRSSSVTDNTYLTSYAYNAAGQLTSATTPATSDFPSGRGTTYAYSTGSEAGFSGGTIPAGLLLSTTTPGNAVTSYTYYSDGDLAKVIEPSGRYTVYTYDQLGRPATSTVYTSSFPSGLATSYNYNAMGQPVTVTHPSVTNTVTGATHALQDSYAYGTDGNLLSLTQSDTTGGDASRVTSYTYNDHDQVASTTQPAGATSGGGSQSQGASSPYPQGAVTGYNYDTSGNVTSVTDPDGNVRRYAYNEYGEVTQVTLYTPSTSQSSPVANCSPPATADPAGGCDLVTGSYTYDPAGLVAATTDAMGRITNYTYDTNQDLIASTTTDASTTPTTGRQTTYSYDGAGNRVSQSVRAMSGGAVGTSTVTNYTIDAAGRLTSELIDPTPSGTSNSGYANRTVSYTYNANNRVTSQTTGTIGGSTSSVTGYGYDTAGDMTSRTVQNGSSALRTTWTYDQNGQALSLTTPASNTTNYTYDQAWNLATVTGPSVQIQTYAAQSPTATRPATSYGYDTFGDRTQAHDPNGNTAVTGYDGDGRVISVTQPSYTPPGASSAITATTSFGYDGNGNLTQVTDPAGNLTKYAYDALGDKVSVTDPQLPGQSAPGLWTYGYDAAGEQLSATDPLNNKTQATYDYFGEHATATDARSNTTSYTHDYLGDLTQTASPDGVVTKNTYDHLGELVSASDAYGNTTGYAYDYAGRIAQLTNPDSSFAQYGYDQAGKLTSVTDYGAAPAGQVAPQLRSESSGYNADGKVTSAKDWNGNTTSYAYNAAGELTSQVKPVSSSSTITTAYGYDPAGNQTAVTGGNGNTTWTTYNTWNQPESVIEPATPAASSAADRTWTTGYDASGRPTSVTEPGGITQSYAYDPLGNLTSQAGSGAAAATTTQTFGYDLASRLTSATAPGGTDTFSYNADSQLNGTTGPSGTSSFGYSNDGLMSSQTSAAGTTSYTYDSAGRLATEADPLTGATLTYAYNPDSQPTSVGYSVSGANGPKQAFGYDPLNRLASDTLTSASGAALAAETYGYDANGNLTSQATTGLTGAGSTTYGYDQANRLTSAASGGTTTSYGYDGDGNLTQAGPTSYAYNAQDQVTTATTSGAATTYAYTLSGALASVTPPSGTPQGYTSNAFGQMTSVPGGIGYAYDGLGRLVTRTTGAGNTSLAWAGTGTTLASDGTSSYSYTPAGAITAAKTGGTGYATMTNLHGDLTAAFAPTSSASSLAGSAAYSPYGTATTAGAMPAIGYQGDYTDPATSQVNMNARWYNPSTGSFTASDTIGGTPVPATLNGGPYSYAGGNPLTGTDPTGHCWVCNLVGGLVGGSASGLDLIAGITTGIALLPAVGIVAGLTGLFTLADWAFFPTPTASGCGIDVICAGLSPGTGIGQFGSIDYGIAGATPVGYGGYPSYGYGYNGYYPYTPPPPPPPPQDCYAGPAPTCKPPHAPSALRHQQLITRTIHDITSASELLRNPRTRVIETVPPNHTPVTGAKPSPLTNGNPATPAGNNPDQILNNIHDIQPGAPSPGTPNQTNTGPQTPSPSPVPAAAGGGAQVPPTPPPAPPAAEAPEPPNPWGNARFIVASNGTTVDVQTGLPNLEFEFLERELADAARAGVSPAEEGTPEFDNVLQTQGQNREAVIWAVLQDGRLVIAPPEAEGIDIAHSVLSGGEPVRAAGMADIRPTDTGYQGGVIDDISGHFQPLGILLRTGIEAFRRIGIEFLGKREIGG